MAIFYKLTDAEGWTRRDYHNAMYWEVGKTNKATGMGMELCSGGVLHFYRLPEMAVIFNLIHAGIKNPRLWEVEGEEVVGDATKGGARELTTIRELPLPSISIEIKIRLAIYCLKDIDRNNIPEWNVWADNWLSGVDRTWESVKAITGIVEARFAEAVWADYSLSKRVVAILYLVWGYGNDLKIIQSIDYAIDLKTVDQEELDEQVIWLHELLMKAIRDEAEFEQMKG